jgi:hypothetical protein
VRSFHPKLTLLDTLRGQGVLQWKGGKTPVAYEISIFLQRGEPSSTGSVDGDLKRAATLPSDTRFTLKLADGRDIDVTLTDIETDYAALASAGDARGTAPTAG